MYEVMKKVKPNLIIQTALVSLMLTFNLSIQGLNTSDKNYIVTYSPSQGVSDISGLNDSISCPVVQYFDGLGRPTQSIAVKQTPNNKDLVINTEYDEMGRPSKSWLPIVSSGEGSYVSPASFYHYYGDNKPYSLNIYENSPLNRVVKEYGPGENWHNAGKGIRNYWYANDQSDSLVVNNYVLSSNTTFTKVGTYESGTLYVNSQIDEDGHKSWKFTDKLGRIILMRNFNGSYHNTYYIFNDFNQLVYVLPPLASDALTATNAPSWSKSTTAINLYGYFYQYDSRGNCVEKKLPGVASQYFVYDKADRLVLSQDGNQRLKSLWTFNKYDKLGRPIIQSIIKLPTNATQSYLIGLCRDSLVIETFNGNTSNYGYSNNFNYGTVTLSEILYYDNYSFINSAWMPGTRTACLAWSSSALDARYVNANLSAKGLMTGTISFLTNNQGSKKYTAYYYDQKGRVVQKNGTNHFNPLSNGTYGIDKYAYAYDYKGNVLHERHQHGGSYYGVTYPEGTKYDYDHAGRLVRTRQYVMYESAIVTTSANAYNELGQLVRKVYGNGLEIQTYNYNIRGWLKEINGSMFSEKLFYERNSQNVAASYNGNICETSSKRLTGNIHTSGWKLNPGQWKENWSTYNYVYDNLNRMTAASANNKDAFSETVTYDKQSNIISLSRYGIVEPGWASDGITPNHRVNVIDYLFYTYNGNQLYDITDYGNSDQLFTGGQDFKRNYMADSYSYDNNGNLKSNFDKNITSIHYNYLNLPDSVQMRNGHMATFGYDATGAKTFVTRRTAIGSTTLMPVGSTLLNNSIGYTTASTQTTMYLDNVVYEDNVLVKVMTVDGMLKRSNPVTETQPVLKYHYFLKDHLGNVRVVFDQDGIINQVNNYYPFGMEYGESSENQAELKYQDYQFGGKEFDRKFELNMYDFGARNYDGTIGRWTTVDPLAEDYYETSPYAYCENNPVNAIDPDGKGVIDINELPEVTVTASKSNPVGTRASDPISGFWGWADYFAFGRTYETGNTRSGNLIPKILWNIDSEGLITGIKPLTGICDVSITGKVGSFLKLRNLAKALKKGEFEVHHLAEVRHLKRLLKSTQNAPSVILNKAEHAGFTKDLRNALPYGKSYSKAEIIEAYKDVYKKQPEWLKAAIDYINQ